MYDICMKDGSVLEAFGPIPIRIAGDEYLAQFYKCSNNHYYLSFDEDDKINKEDEEEINAEWTNIDNEFVG